MSEHEDMLQWWTITLISVLEGITMASVQMERVGQGERVAELFTEDVRLIMSGYPPGQRWLLVRQFILLSGLAVRVEPPNWK